MPYFSLDPVFTRPKQINTLADATTSMFADMSLSPANFGSNEQLRNAYFLVRRTAKTLCLHLGKSRGGITLEELLNLDDVLIRVALDEKIDRKHASIYATGCRKIIEYARDCGWSCDAIVRMEAWEPVKKALKHTKDCALQLVKFLIVAGKIPAETTEEDLQSWHDHATEDGPEKDRMLPATADLILVRFRRRIRRCGLEYLFPHLDLKSNKPTSYRKKKEDWAPAICAEIQNLVATRAPIHLPGRDHKKALRPASIQCAVDSLSAVYGCLEDHLNRGPFDCLAQMLTTTNLCDSIDWLRQRGLLRQGVHRILDSILALANRFPNLDCSQVRKHIKQVPSEPKHRMHARKQEKSLPYDALSVISGELQRLIDAGGLTKLDVAWLLHDKALITTLHKLVLRQRNLRECKLPYPDVKDANLVWEPLTPELLHDCIIPDCVRAAYNADRSRTRTFLMLKFNEKQTKGKRAETEILSLDHAAALQDFLDVRSWLLEQINAKKHKPEPNPLNDHDHEKDDDRDPGTLFLNRHGRPLREHNVRDLVKRLTRNYAGKSVPPHLWRDIYAANFKILLAIGVESDPDKLAQKLWHIDQPTTDGYSHLDRALPGIAMLNQQYRATQQTARKEISEQFDQLDSQRDRAA